jgi:hypothetical protein
MEVNVQLHTPAALSPGEEPAYEEQIFCNLSNIFNQYKYLVSYVIIINWTFFVGH